VTHTDGETMLSIAIAALMLLTVILSVLPKECVCENCAFHRHARQQAREADRVKRHRQTHAAFRLPWPHAQCGECNAGHSDDQPRET
jgi:hypothetical protein